MPQQLEQSMECYPLLGGLLEYPCADSTRQFSDAMELFSACPDIAEALRCFDAETIQNGIDAWEDLYTRTFLVSAPCTLYASVHLFGAENRKRALLMTGLAEAYEREGFNRGSELPDHLPTILRFFPLFTQEECEEMVCYCLRSTVATVWGGLESAKNPYRHILRVVQLVLSRDFPEEDLSC